MASNASESKNGVESVKDETKPKKPLSRSNTDECDEWVLVSSLDTEEMTGQRDTCSNVSTAAVFEAPTLPADEAAAMLFETKPSAYVKSDIIDTPSQRLDIEGTESLGIVKPEEPSIEVSLSETVPTLTVTSVAEKETVEEKHSQPEEKIDTESIESNETLSRDSSLDRVEHVLPLLEELPPSSAASSVDSGDVSGYEMVANADSGERNEEDSFMERNDDQPVNQNLMYSSRVWNTPVYLKLSLLVVVIALLGYAIKHQQFIDNNSEMDTSENEFDQQQQEQLKILQGRLADCLGRLHQTETELEDGRARYSIGCSEGYCRPNEMPDCSADGNVQVQISECSKRLETCQARMKTLEAENNNRSGQLLKAFRDLRLLRHNLLQVYAIYERLSDLLLAEKHGGVEMDTKLDPGSSEIDKEELLKKLTEAESREEKLLKQETELRRMLHNLESTVESLNTELTKMKRKWTENRDESETGWEKSTGHGDEEDEEELGSELNWNLLTNLLQQFKDGAKFNQIFENYLDIFKDVKLPEINMNKLLEVLPESLEDMATNLKHVLDEKIDEVEQTLYNTNWDSYVQKAKDVTSQMGETVGNLWQKTKDLSDQVRERHGEQGEQILNHIKSKMEKANEIFDQRWEQAANFMKDVIGSISLDEEENEEIVDDEEQQNSEAESDPEPEPEQSSDYNRHYMKKGESKQSQFQSQLDSFDDPPRSHDGPASNSMSQEIRQLRDILKSSDAFLRYVKDEFADHYFRRLKQAAGSGSEEDSAWWKCQKLWWARHTMAYSRQCSTRLMTWQRHGRDDTDIRQKLITEIPALKMLIRRSSAGSKLIKENEDGNWVFEWAKNRQELRKQEDQRKNDEKNWLYKRWRSRDEIRGQEETDGKGGSKWLFRRGMERERERKRGDEHERNWNGRRSNAIRKERMKDEPTNRHWRSKRR